MSHHSGRWSFLRSNFWQNWLMTFWSTGLIEKNKIFLPGTNWRITQRGKNFSRLENNKKTATTTTTTMTKTTTTTTTTTTQQQQHNKNNNNSNNSKISSWKRTRRRLAKPRVQISVRSSPSKLHRDFRQIFVSCWRIKLIDIETISTFQSKPAFSSNVSLSTVAQLSIKEKGSGGGASGRAMAFCPCRPGSGIPGGTWLFRFRIAVYQFSLGVGLSIRTCNRMMHTPSLSSL